MGRSIKRLSREERSENVVQYAMLAVFFVSMIGLTLFALSGAVRNFAALAAIE